ncbi:MAG: magnesium and cobalt transport protein CorA, partial [Bacteroidota bacterium]
MRKIKYKKGRKVQPSLLEYTGKHKDAATEMQLFVYDNEDLTEFSEFKVDQCERCFDLTKTNWLNVHGLNNIEVIKSIGDYLYVDNFMLGDIL